VLVSIGFGPLSSGNRVLAGLVAAPRRYIFAVFADGCAIKRLRAFNHKGREVICGYFGYWKRPLPWSPQKMQPAARGRMSSESSVMLAAY